MTETHPEKRLIGYARVSTYGQTLDAQLEQLRDAGCGSRNIYREKVTGARADRRELSRMLGKLAPGKGPGSPKARRADYGHRASL
jgi:DNA invertase Pin-like site-specific DNA recombinase